MAPAGDTQLPSAHDIKREVTAVLRGADDPNLLTFKQVNKSCPNEIPRNSRLNTQNTRLLFFHLRYKSPFRDWRAAARRSLPPSLPYLALWIGGIGSIIELLDGTVVPEVHSC